MNRILAQIASPSLTLTATGWPAIAIIVGMTCWVLTGLLQMIEWLLKL